MNWTLELINESGPWTFFAVVGLPVEAYCTIEHTADGIVTTYKIDGDPREFTPAEFDAELQARGWQ